MHLEQMLCCGPSKPTILGVLLSSSVAKPSVRLVDELQLQIERRASKGKPVDMKQPPKPPKLSSTLREQNRPVLHDQVEIRSQVFQEHEGQFVQQIQIHAVHANACRVIITDQATANCR